ncbi:glycosyltransferase, partial [candidate division WOR-3 bacterium]|nr:glycosyltransferase [candidate division WOR-3 bacterium]
MNKQKNSRVNKIRILRVISSDSARKSFKRKDDKEGGAICGPESKALELCSKLNRRKFETIMVYGKRGRIIKEFENIGVRVEKIETISKFNLYEALYLYRMIKANKIDILQTHGLRFDFFGGISAMLSHVPHIITRHVAISQHLISNFRKNIYIFFDNIAIKFAAKVVTVSKTVENDLVINQGVDRSKIVTILNGVDLERFSKGNSTRIAMRKEFGMDDKKQIVGMIAQLSYWKGIPYFLRAIPLILRKCPD